LQRPLFRAGAGQFARPRKPVTLSLVALCVAGLLPGPAAAQSTGYSLLVSPSVAAGLSRIRVDWTGPAGHSGRDWIALHVAGAPNTSYLTFLSTGPDRSGTLTFTAPDTPGAYEFRFLLDNGYSEPEPPARAPLTISSPPQYSITYEQGGVYWTAPPGHSARDRIGLFRRGAPSTEYLDLWHRDGLGDSTSGGFGWEPPRRAGVYELRFLIDGTFEEPTPPVRFTIEVPGPDLEVFRVTNVPGEVSQGDSFMIADEVRNAGGASAPASTALHFFSTDAAYSADDVFAGYRLVPELAAGGGSAVAVRLDVPESLPGGNYFVVACADAFHAVVETDETDNCRAKAGTLMVRAPPTPTPDSNRYSLGAPLNPIRVGHPFSLDWRAPQTHGLQDAIRPFQPGAPNNEPLQFGWYLAAGTFGTIPDAGLFGVGVHEFRIQLDGTFDEPCPPARARVVIVPTAFSLNIEPAVVAPGSPVPVQWTAPYGHGSADRLLLFPAGTSSLDAEITSQYLPIETAGVLELTAPATPGLYEVRIGLGGTTQEPDPLVRAAYRVDASIRTTRTPTLTPTRTLTPTSTASPTPPSTPTPPRTNRWFPIGPFGGVVSNLVIDPQTPATLYATLSSGTHPSGLFKSIDGAASWEEVDVPQKRIVAVALDPQRSGTIYIATVRASGSDPAAGLFRSTDGGLTWSLTALAGDRFTGQTISVAPGSGTVFVGSAEGAFKSTNAGDSWVRVSTLPALPISIIAFDPRDSRRAFAVVADTNRLYASADGGVTWRPLRIPAISAEVSQIAFSPAADGSKSTAYVIIGDAVYVADDESLTLRGRRQDHPNELVPCEIGGAECAGLLSGPYLSIAADPLKSGRLYVSGGLPQPGADSGVVWRSEDAGATWTRSNRFVSAAALHRGPLLVDPRQSQNMYLATTSGVLKSTDQGAHWHESNRGMADFAAYLLSIDPAHPSTLYSALATYPQTPRLLKTDDGGSSWRLLRSDSTNFVVPDGRQPGLVYSAVNEGATPFRFVVLKSTNGGDDWLSSGYEIALRHSFYPFALDPHSPGTLYLGSHFYNPPEGGCSLNGTSGNCATTGLYRSDDQGGSWYAIPGDFPTLDAFKGVMTALQVSPEDPNVLFLTTAGKTFVWGALYRGDASPNPLYPFNWTRLQTFLSRTTVFSIDQRSPATLYVGTERHGLYKSTDRGAHITRLDLGAASRVSAVAVDPADSMRVYAGTPDRGVLRSTDAGITWEPMNDGLWSRAISALVIDPDDSSILYAATGEGYFGSSANARAVFKIKLGDLCRSTADCNDRNSCTADRCDPSSPDADIAGCTYGPLANGTACNDGNACTRTDACSAGVCFGSNPLVCPTAGQPDQCEEPAACDPVTGSCSTRPRPDGFLCNDSDTCTRSDRCRLGACVGGDPVVCAATDTCHDAGVCNPSNGVCSNPAKPNGVACPDGLFCNGAETCRSGACAAGTPPCPAGECNEVADRCTNCGNGHIDAGEQCDDGDLVHGDGCDASCRTTVCAGDCSDDLGTDEAELLTGIALIFGDASLVQCSQYDVDLDGRVKAHELVAAIGARIGGCPALGPTRTRTPIRIATRTPTATPPTASASPLSATPTRTPTSTVRVPATPTPSVVPTVVATNARLTARVFFDDGETPVGSGIQIRLNGEIATVTGDDGAVTLVVQPGYNEVRAVYPYLGGAAAGVILEPGEHRSVNLALRGEQLAEAAWLVSDDVAGGVLPADFPTLTLWFVDITSTRIAPDSLESISFNPVDAGTAVDLTDHFRFAPDGTVEAVDLDTLRSILGAHPEGGALRVSAGLAGGTYLEGDITMRIPRPAQGTGGAAPCATDSPASGASTPTSAPTPCRIPTAGYRLEVMARTGRGFSEIDSRVSINDEGIVAFAGRDSENSKGFVSSQPGHSLGLTLHGPSRTFSGSAINNAAVPEVVFRELVQGPYYLIRRWAIDGSVTLVGTSGGTSGSCTGGTRAGLLCGSHNDCRCFPAPTPIICTPGFCRNGPSDFESATSFVDLNDNGVAAFTGLVEVEDSTALALFRGSTSAAEVARFSDVTAIIRPQIANNRDIVIRDDQHNIVVYPGSGADPLTIAGAGSGFVFTGSHPGISHDGSLIAFIGDRGFGRGVFLAQNPGGDIWPVAGPEINRLAFVSEFLRAQSSLPPVDSFDDLPDGHRVGVVSVQAPLPLRDPPTDVTVVFAASPAGRTGVYARQIRFRCDQPESISPAQLVLEEGTKTEEGEVLSFALYDPVNRRGDLAIWVRLCDDSRAVVRASPPLVPNDVHSRYCDSFFSIPTGNQKPNETQRDLLVPYPGLRNLTAAVVNLFGEGPVSPVEVLSQSAPLVLGDWNRAQLSRVSIDSPPEHGPPAPLSHSVHYEATLSGDDVLDGDAASIVNRSDALVALWQMPELLANGTIRRYSTDDLGGDAWAALGTINWLRSMSQTLRDADLELRVNDISGEHGVNLGHSSHGFGTDLDIFHFQNLLSRSSRLNGGENYLKLLTLVRLAIGEWSPGRPCDSSCGSVKDFFTKMRQGIEALFKRSQPPDAVSKVLTLNGCDPDPSCQTRCCEPMTPEGRLERHWPCAALESGIIRSTAGNVLLDLALPTWALKCGIGQPVEPYLGHNDHIHVGLDRCRTQPAAAIPRVCEKPRVRRYEVKVNPMTMKGTYEPCPETCPPRPCVRVPPPPLPTAVPAVGPAR